MKDEDHYEVLNQNNGCGTWLDLLALAVVAAALVTVSILTTGR